LIPNRVVESCGAALLEVGPAASPDQQGVAGEGATLLQAHVSHASVGVTGRLPDLEAVASECQDVPVLDVEIGLGPARLGDDRLDPHLRQQALQKTGSSDVIRVNMGIDAIFEIESKVFDGFGVSFSQFDDGVNDDSLTGIGVGQHIRVSARGPVEQLSEQKVL